MKRRNVARLAGLVCVLSLLTPVAVEAITYRDDLDRESTSEFGGRDDVLFVTTQGTETLDGARARAVAIDTRSGEVVWSHRPYERYFDIDPLDDRTVLFLGAEGPHGANMWVHVVDWRANETLLTFRVPRDTHDVDYLGGSEFVVADKAAHRVYVYDAANGTVVWEYRFRARFSASDGTPEDYTHLNDVDPVANGTKFLVSPRNFDRVLLLNRTTKEVEWTLGSEDAYDVLHEQHNPVLLSRNPPTVLVADSENDRIVEYRRTDDGWEQVWAYRGSVQWPRDADRLPNGNTLVVDTSGQRVLEVTPSHEVVWEISVVKAPYDAELLSLGDEPAGPSMAAFTGRFDGPTAEQPRFGGVVQGRASYLLSLSQWVVPWRVTVLQLLLLSGALLVGASWMAVETSRWLGHLELPSSGRYASVFTRWLALVTVGLGVTLWIAPGVDRFAAPFWRGVGWLAVVSGLPSVRPWQFLERRPGSSDGPRPCVSDLTEPSVTVLGGTGALVAILLTDLNAFYLAVGGLLSIETVRYLPSDRATGRRGRAVYSLLANVARLGSLLVAVLLLYISPSTRYAALYLGLAALLVTNALLLERVAPAGSLVGQGRDVPNPFVDGLRLLVVALALVVVTAFGLMSLQPTTLSGPYAAVALLGLRPVTAGRWER